MLIKLFNSNALSIFVANPRATSNTLSILLQIDGQRLKYDQNKCHEYMVKLRCECNCQANTLSNANALSALLNANALSNANAPSTMQCESTESQRVKFLWSTQYVINFARQSAGWAQGDLDHQKLRNNIHSKVET